MITIAQAEKATRAMLRRNGFETESVAWVQRTTDREFAAIVISNNWPEKYEEALELLTRPGCPLNVTRERVGKYDTRIFIELAI